jgi:large subunit ribosomal protein L9
MGRPKATTFRSDFSTPQPNIFHMAKTEVILTHNIIGLGGESDNVRVAAGYARNFLFPQRLAVPVTSANKRQMEALKQKRAEREANELNHMNDLSKALQKLVCIIKVKTGEDGKLFGSVTSGTIADELKHQFDIALDKKKIKLEHAIRATGEFEVELNLHADVKGTLKVRVESTTPIVAPAAAVVEEKAHTVKRGHRGDIIAPTEAELKEKAEKKTKAAKKAKAE